MGERKRLGLIFSYDEQWIGGTYYIINLIESFNALNEEERPEVVVFSNETDFARLRKETRFPYLAYELLNSNTLSSWQAFFNKLSLKIFKHSVFKNQYVGKLDALFLFQQCSYLESVPMRNRIYWIPDFQDKHFPEFFSKEALERKDRRSKWISKNVKKLILSSESVYSDWKKFYPEHNCSVKVVHFAVTHPKYEHISIEDLRHKYSLPDVYFFAPNQFWAHKNHIVLIKAAEELKKAGTPIVVAFSGKENDNRNPGYTESLKEYVIKNQLSDVVRFLGFLDRAEQLQLMKNARAIIQPSKFEGWSTVNEDAMAMNQPLIVSDLEVNIEQLGINGVFFKRDIVIELADKILIDNKMPRKVIYDYPEKLRKFALKFVELIQE
jgi:glycosyltransferase involved in cell wall biosynthesis